MFSRDQPRRVRFAGDRVRCSSCTIDSTVWNSFSVCNFCVYRIFLRAKLQRRKEGQMEPQRLDTFGTDFIVAEAKALD